MHFFDQHLFDEPVADVGLVGDNHELVTGVFEPAGAVRYAIVKAERPERSRRERPSVTKFRHHKDPVSINENCSISHTRNHHFVLRT